MTLRLLPRLGAVVLLGLAASPLLRAGDVPAGHSAHGEVFDEGPRQQAYLMGGTGKVNLTITTHAADAQAFFNQGLGQLHGFWYFEAERSFRQVAALDPDCAMAYWGMALANLNNPTRARPFIQKAVERKGKASRREQLWIDAYAAYWSGSGDDREHRRQLVHALENLQFEFPDELEAKAFLAFHIWDNSSHGLPISSRLAVDALLKEVFAVEPMHPAHHFQIHLWDEEKPARALESAARCGQAAPNIAHMWHMPGHIYVRLHRYADAAWQQEASARVDHRHMMQDHVLPDQIHNYAHNNQWLVEDLEFVGRVHDAVGLAKNLLSLPRHPSYNTLGLKPDGTLLDHDHGSAGEGRRRLFEVLTRYEMWDELIALCDTMYLEPTDIPAEQIKRLRLLGLAHFGKGEVDKGRQQIAALETLRQKVEAERQAAGDQAESKARQENKAADQVARIKKEAQQKFEERVTLLTAALADLHAYQFLAEGDRKQAAASLDQAKDIPRERLAQLQLQLGNTDRALQLAREDVETGENQVFRLANYVDLLQRSGRTKEAQEQFQRLRKLSAEIDLDVPLLKRLAPVAQGLGLPADWRVAKQVATDVGNRPNLDDLGPVHWEPTAAPEWTLSDQHGKPVGLRDYRGRPVVLIFFLGGGCPHCLEQLRAFQEKAEQFRAAGISLAAISSDPSDNLQDTAEKCKLPADFTLLSDEALKVFRAYRTFDDFEKVPLHGTFLIDGTGKVRWQDISYEPFKDPAFLLAESQRLLRLSTTSEVSSVRADAR